jgi:hypothetical protein
MPGTSPSSQARARRRDQALDEARRAAGNDTNRNGADQQVRPSHGDPPRSSRTPNTGNGRVAWP